MKFLLGRAEFEADSPAQLATRACAALKTQHSGFVFTLYVFACGGYVRVFTRRGFLAPSAQQYIRHRGDIWCAALHSAQHERNLEQFLGKTVPEFLHERPELRLV